MCLSEFCLFWYLDLTGAVNSLKATDMEKEQRQTIQDMLRSGVAGLAVGMETDAKGNTNYSDRGEMRKERASPFVTFFHGFVWR